MTRTRGGGGSRWALPKSSRDGMGTTTTLREGGVKWPFEWSVNFTRIRPLFRVFFEKTIHFGFNILGHANCPPPYPLAWLHGTILYPPPQKQGMNFAPRGPLALERKKWISPFT